VEHSRPGSQRVVDAEVDLLDFMMEIQGEHRNELREIKHLLRQILEELRPGSTSVTLLVSATMTKA
jgi:hypothetical protein